LESALGNGWAESVHPEDVERIADTYAAVSARRDPFQMEYRIRRHDGEYRWILGSGLPRYDAEGSFAGYLGTSIDITEIKDAEAALSSLRQRLIEAQEDERGRLARELHDDINQRLAVLNIRLGMLAQSAPASMTEGRRKIKEICDEVGHLMRDVQALSYRLHPPRLEFLGIEEAAASMCRELSGQSVEVSFQAQNVPAGLSSKIAVCLYRVLQEALQNAIKHSRAAKIEVSLRGGADQIELAVDDFGVGFDLSARERGLGLTSMHERLKALDGGLAIRSEPQRGTSIRARVPLLQH
jgi:signal transduction histidine kinase